MKLHTARAFRFHSVCAFSFLYAAALLFPASLAARADEASGWRAGTAKIDITPEAPLRLSGYASRTEPSEGIDTPLWVRAVALATPNDRPHVLISVDTIGLPGSLVTEASAELNERIGLSRSQLAVSCTHSHVAPHLANALTNLLREPLSDEEHAASIDYSNRIQKAIVEATIEAIDDMQPVTVEHGTGTAEFAINRRVLRDGTWTGFGETPSGPVDHTVDVLRMADAEGSPLAVLFNYACHCTTLGPDHNRVNAEWAGYATTQLEGGGDLVALCTIGCGADANPSPRGELAMCKQHGESLAVAVRSVLAEEMRPIEPQIKSTFGYAGLEFDLPTKAELQVEAESSDVHLRRRAEHYLEVFERKGRLPATYPMPVQTWSLGDSLTMIFLGGEVVVDYALRLKKEIETPGVWVTAYANDVFAYVPSERVRKEGGYEVAKSMVYYNQPGPWAASTEKRVIDQVHSQLKGEVSSGDLSVDEARDAFRVADGWRVEIAASEPQLADPIFVAFDATERAWVVEMGDYPHGEAGDAGSGRIKILSDEDGDGHYETAQTFLDGLSVPTGVFPWRNGAIVSCAPDVFFAEDTDGDGRADRREKMLSGFALANPQHRVNGFTEGLDGWLYFAAGDDCDEVHVHATNETVHAAGRDLALNPETGELRLEFGPTQYGRYRNDWGVWYGGNNSRPIWHYVYHAVDPNRIARGLSTRDELLQPAVAPPVFAAARVGARFNDLFAAGRFTSACSPAPVRDQNLRRAMLDAEADPGEAFTDVALIPEPVHNLVHRAIIHPEGAALTARRHQDDQSSEWLASIDPWFRPVQAVAAPDGSIWVVDMYRETIEHPQWIPDDWQAQLNLRAGSKQGRIWRLVPDGSTASPGGQRAGAAESAIDRLSHANGFQRDRATRELVAAMDDSTAERLHEVARRADSPTARLHAFAALARTDRTDSELVATLLADRNPGVVAYVLQQSRLLPSRSVPKADALIAAADHPHPVVRFQAALTLGQMSDSPDTNTALYRMAISNLDDNRILDAVLCGIGDQHRNWAKRIAANEQDKQTLIRSANGERLLQMLLNRFAQSDAAAFTDWVNDQLQQSPSDSWRLRLLHTWTAAISESEKAKKLMAERAQLAAAIGQLAERLGEPNVDIEMQQTLLQLVAAGLIGEEKTDALMQFFSPEYPIATQRNAAVLLTQQQTEEARAALYQNFASWEPGVQAVALATLMQRRDDMKDLLSALESEAIPTSLVSADVRQTLLQQGDKSIRVRATRLFGQGPSEDREAVLSEYRPAARAGGDPAAGKLVFKRACSSCHQIGEVGFAVGPDLRSLGNRSTDALLTGILDPNAAIEAKFRSATVVTLDGQILAGLITDQTAKSITLVRPNGLTDTIDRSEIDMIKAAADSLMPANLEKDLTAQDVADVIAYLQTL